MREGPGLMNCVFWHLTSCVARGKNNVNCNRMSGNETENKNKISHCLQKAPGRTKTKTDIPSSTDNFTSNLEYHYFALVHNQASSKVHAEETSGISG